MYPKKKKTDTHNKTKIGGNEQSNANDPENERWNHKEVRSKVTSEITEKESERAEWVTKMREKEARMVWATTMRGRIEEEEVISALENGGKTCNAMEWSFGFEGFEYDWVEC